MLRIREIELQGFKNVNFGRVVMPMSLKKSYFDDGADILGIYGQNGSGKTAVIDALCLLKKLFCGESLKNIFESYMQKGADNCTICLKFVYENAYKRAFLDYNLSIKNTQNSLNIDGESLSITDFSGDKFAKKRLLISYIGDKNISPKKALDDIKDKSLKAALNTARKTSGSGLISLLFGEIGYNILTKYDTELSVALKAIKQYAEHGLFTYISGKKTHKNISLVIGSKQKPIEISLSGASLIEKARLNPFLSLVEQMNVVIKTIIPNLALEVKILGGEILANGEEGVKFEMMSVKEGRELPLGFESEGIIKMVGILNMLMCIYGNRHMCLAIDEMDSGIFEFLLGELLLVFEKGAKGQLIFTSHNLRALEMIDRRNLSFATTNPDNKYIQLKRVKKDNNLRDLYLRTILLGGQAEQVYLGQDSVEIGRAFRRAKRMQNDAEKE